VATPAPRPGQTFEEFLHAFRAEALAAGIRPAVYDRVMARVTFQPRIVQLTETQPEFVKPIWSYLDTAVSPLRVSDGRQKEESNRLTLDRIENRFGVSQYILVAIWGMETDYGQAAGNFNLFNALTSLAYDGPRTAYARPQLIAALRMVQQDGFQPADMTSSWAGAFGQTQFVPTTFLAKAVDFDGDGRKDLWHSPADALASTANLLASEGWMHKRPWGYEVRLPHDFPYAQADLDIVKRTTEWGRMGVTTALGAPLHDANARGAILLPAGADGPAFMVFDNFRTLLKYNNSISYALAVCLLADRIRGMDTIVAHWPRSEQPLSRDDRFAFQQDLKTLGYDPGTVDGMLGSNTRAALRAYQRARGLPADGFATKALLDRMNRELAGHES
jgi:membrane-bound lytic murein transglycosylase B